MSDSHTSPRTSRPLVLVTGATGYVGGRLLRALQEGGHAVRCLARRPEFLRGRVAPTTEVIEGDLLQPATLPAALAGVDTAFYLVHSMGTGRDFERDDREAAINFGVAAGRAGVRRIVYLGGLGDEETHLSPHLRSRQETGELLRQGPVPVIEFRASAIIGSGSLSFELARALVERLPLMVCPRWVDTPAQPIAIEDVIAYLLASLDLRGDQSRIYEIGGADCVSYGEIMREYARQRGLRRVFLPVPFLTPRLSSLWLALTTPVYARVGRKLIEGVRNPTRVRDARALDDFAVRPMGLPLAIARAMLNEDRAFAETRWSDALSSGGPVRTWAGVRFGSRLVDTRTVDLRVSPAHAFAPIRRIGGDAGWYFGDWLWRLRGLVDSLIGGVGLRRGRGDAEHPRPGEALDFWRVEAYEPDRQLRLVAEMRLPGRAWLQFDVEPTPGGSRIRQTAMFDPLGLKGLLYWYLVYPLHALIFGRMLKAIARRAERDARWAPAHAGAQPASR
jgi:uncharacterized protein YbjT (DUF2867 family)